MASRRVRLLLHQMDYAFGAGGWVVAYSKALEGLTAGQAAWIPGVGSSEGPIPGANSIWQMTNHLAFWKELITRRIHGAPLAGPRIRNQDTFGLADPRDEEGWKAAVQRLYTAHQSMREAVAQLRDAQLEQPLSGESTPLGTVLAELNLHDAYHLGQILLTRKLQHRWKDRE
ncbi:MAG: DinB family protein [Mycobacterium leprae]